MSNFTRLTEQVKQSYSARAGLVAVGLEVTRRGIFEPIHQQVKINQKQVKYSPTEKLLDGFIGMLSGAGGMVEINQRVRPDQALQQAFGRRGCADQSVVQDTLDACTAQNVQEMEAAVSQIYQRHSRGYRHNYQWHWQVLEVDLSGQACGKKAAFASKGYFATKRNRRGRQVGYVTLAAYQEVVVKQLYAGQTQLFQALPELVQMASTRLGLDQAKRHQTILRVDAGGGSSAAINGLLAQGYHYHGKDYSGPRVKKLLQPLSDWLTDPTDPNRQVAWLATEPALYVQPVRRLAVRCRKKNGQWGLGIIVSTLTPSMVLELTDQDPRLDDDEAKVALAYLYFYDQRGGGIEIDIKQDKQGLATSKRNKKRFAAQQILLQLELLAHNTIIWCRHWLSDRVPALARLGLKRWIRDLFHIPGLIYFTHHQRISHIVFQQAHPLAPRLAHGLAPFLANQHVTASLGQT
jgi:Transposase DDE domain group 1